MNEWLHAHWPTLAAFFSGLTASGGLIKWFLKREIRHLEDRHAGHDQGHSDHESRLRKIEESRVTQANIDELRMSLMASITLAHSDLTRSISSIQSDVRVLTEHLLGRKQ